MSEQLPKEVERTRLSSGLRNLGNSQETDPLKRLAEIYSVPGVTPEIANQVSQYVQSNQLRNATNRNGEPQNNTSISPMENREAMQNNSATANVPKFDRMSSNYLTPSDAATIDQRAAQIQDQTGILFQKAQEVAQREDDKRVEAERGFEARNDLAEKEFNKYVDTATQKEAKDYSDIIGDMKNDYLTKLQNDVANGKSPRQASLDRSKELLDFAKARSALRSQGQSFWKSLFTNLPTQQVTAAKKIYDKYDSPELLMNDLITYQKFSKPRASAIAFPPKEQGAGFFSNLKRSNGAEVNDAKVFDQALEKLSNKDSLQSFALQLQKKGYSPQGFLSYALKNSDKLTARQSAELQNIGSFQPSMSDILYFTLTGKD